MRFIYSLHNWYIKIARSDLAPKGAKGIGTVLKWDRYKESRLRTLPRGNGLHFRPSKDKDFIEDKNNDIRMTYFCAVMIVENDLRQSFTANLFNDYATDHQHRVNQLLSEIALDDETVADKVFIETENSDEELAKIKVKVKAAVMKLNALDSRVKVFTEKLHNGVKAEIASAISDINAAIDDEGDNASRLFSEETTVESSFQGQKGVHIPRDNQRQRTAPRL